MLHLARPMSAHFPMDPCTLSNLPAHFSLQELLQNSLSDSHFRHLPRSQTGNGCRQVKGHAHGLSDPEARGDARAPDSQCANPACVPGCPPLPSVITNFLKLVIGAEIRDVRGDNPRESRCPVERELKLGSFFLLEKQLLDLGDPKSVGKC